MNNEEQAKVPLGQVNKFVITEGRKDDSGKLARFDLIPARPLWSLAELYGMGAMKYDDRNWEKGIAWCRVFGAMMRHAWAWFRGERYDRECRNIDCRNLLPVEASSMPVYTCPKCGQNDARPEHLACVSWACFTLMEYEETKPERDDRPWMKGRRPVECNVIINSYDSRVKRYNINPDQEVTEVKHPLYCVVDGCQFIRKSGSDFCRLHTF